MKPFAKRLDSFNEYIFASLLRDAKKVEQKTGRKVLSLAVGSPDVPPSKKALEKLKQFIDMPGAHLYPGFGAKKEFSQAVQTYYKKRFGVTIKEDELIPLLGAKDGTTHLPMALLDEGDEFLTPNPGYPGFTGAAIMMSAKPVFYTLKEENNFKPDLKELEKLVTKKTKYIWINFPSNPTGQTASLAELKKYCAFAKKHNLLILYDNAYAEMYYGKNTPPSIFQVPGAKNYAVELHSLSKTYSLAGYRIGFAAGSAKVIAALAKVKSQADSGLSLPLQYLAAYMLSTPDTKWRKDMLKSYTKRRDVLEKTFKKLGLTFKHADAGLYIWARIPKVFKDSEQYAKFLLEKKQVLVTPGTAFGSEGKRYIRISFCSNIEHIEEYL
ncbi:aspartate/methionine/tyrosine aminotransferase [Elusimicrobium posterum]|uniref:pyridoxal phosphate-dependent aminotransferase n=1 Tax=Elusimicrobium posterum TaxID=3116653 RepID=UPI003C7800D4